MESYIPKNSINTPLEPSNIDLIDKLKQIKIENERLRKNSQELKFQLIKARKKIFKISSIINK
tara:strand:- start:2188 stop:2376 length:189 start_codon:yes stop_codon:yes gene_type:complete